MEYISETVVSNAELDHHISFNRLLTSPTECMEVPDPEGGLVFPSDVDSVVS